MVHTMARAGACRAMRSRKLGQKARLIVLSSHMLPCSARVRAVRVLRLGILSGTKVAVPACQVKPLS